MEDWQFRCKKVIERGAHILETGQWADCVFLVGREDDQKRFSVHKLFLSMATPVFDCMLNGPMADSEEVIHIPDVQPEAFYALLVYIYTDKIRIQTNDDAFDIYYSAKKYMLPQLMDGCIAYLLQNLTPQNVCRIYDFARMYDEIILLNKCIQVIQEYTKELLSDGSFLETKISTVRQILGYTLLNIDSELDLFFAVEKYSESHLKEEELGSNTALDDAQSATSSSSNDETILEAGKENEENKDLAKMSSGDCSQSDELERCEVNKTENQIFRTLIQEVKLLTLTPQQFAENVALSPFLTQEESYALLMNVSSKNSGIPMPKGFNTSRKNRYKLKTDPDCNLDLGVHTDKGRLETTYRFSVTDFAETMYMSLPFYVCNLAWQIAVNPKTKSNNENEKHIGIFIYCSWVNNGVHWSCPVRAEINLVSHKSNAVHLIRSVDHVFTSTESNRGCHIPLKTILDPKNGYMRNNTLTIEVHIMADRLINK